LEFHADPSVLPPLSPSNVTLLGTLPNSTATTLPTNTKKPKIIFFTFHTPLLKLLPHHVNTPNFGKNEKSVTYFDDYL
jgi:hypothetical protein